MTYQYDEGIAFILEGDTEKVFYINLLEFFASETQLSSFEKKSLDNGDIVYEWIDECKTILIKINVVGTVSQITNSADWFNNKCIKVYDIPWTVFLCYDTDSPEHEISKFHDGDWAELRKKLKKSKRLKEVIDLAASADIEDILLYDIDGIYNFLGSEEKIKPVGRKGKAKIKHLFRKNGKTYHSGKRAADLIKFLDMNKIIQDSPIGLNKIKEVINKNE